MKAIDFKGNQNVSDDSEATDAGGDKRLMEEDRQGVDTKGKRSRVCLSVANHRWMLRHKADRDQVMYFNTIVSDPKNRFPCANVTQTNRIAIF